MKMASSSQLWYIRASAGRYIFSMGSPAWWRFGLWSSGSSLVSRWRDAPLVHARISNVTSQMLTDRSALISGASNEFLVNLINHIEEIFHNVSGPTVHYYTFLTRALLHPIFNSLLTPATSCEPQAKACDIEISQEMLWVGVSCFFFQGKYIFYVLINIFFKQKNILFNLLLTFWYELHKNTSPSSYFDPEYFV